MVATHDFFGLGRPASPDPHRDPHQHPSSPLPEDAPLPVASNRLLSSFPSFDGSPISSGDRSISFAGTKDPVWNQSVAVHDFLSLRSVLGAKHIEGSADSQCISQSQLHLNRVHGTGGMTNSEPRLFVADNQNKQNGGQLTIFYAGHVNVYEDVPVGKARAIMDLAATANTSTKKLSGSVQAPHPFKKQPLQVARNLEQLYFNDGVQICQNHYATDQVRQSTSPVNLLLDCHTPNTACSDSNSQLMVPQALPQARKASLTRFLERRKERMHVICPYMKKEEQAMQNPITDSKSGASYSKQYNLNSILMAIGGDYAEQPAEAVETGVKELDASMRRSADETKRL